MGFYIRNRPSSIDFGGPVPGGIKWLLIANTAVFVPYYLQIPLLDELLNLGALNTSWVIRGAIWQPFTYLFLHGGIWHILMNMLMLWMFGADLERDWGRRRFMNYYFVCGVGAGLCVVAADLLTGGPFRPTIGASGAIFGVLVAFGLLYPHRTVLFMFIFPIPAWVFVAILGGWNLLDAIAASRSGMSSGVSYVAHLGGLAIGFIYLRYKPSFLTIDWAASYRQWQLRRAKRKFEVYMKKKDRSDGGGWVN